MSNTVVSSGEIVSNISISYGEQLIISTFGSAYNTSIYSGGQLTVSTFGNASNTSIYSGGQLTVSSLGGVSDTSIYAGGKLTVVSNGNASNTSILSDGQLTVSSYGRVSDTSIYAGGKLTVVSNGNASNTNILSGGNLIVTSYGSVSDTSIYSGGNLTVSSNGSVTRTIILSGAEFVAASGTTVTGTMISDGGLFSIISGANISRTMVSSGGVFIVSALGSVSDTSIYSGGLFSVISGASVSRTIILSGAEFTASSGASITDITISDGGLFTASPGANVKYVSILSGAQLTVASGANVANISILSGVQYAVSSGINISGIYVSSGGQLTVASGAITSSVSVSSGGQISVTSGASIIDTTINSGGQLTVASGAITSRVTIFSGGQISVASGASIIDTTINSGGQLTVALGVNVSGIFIYSGGQLTVSSGVTISNAYINSADLIGPSGVTFYNASIGGEFTIPSNMNFIHTSVYTSAKIIVASGATMSDTQVFAQGTLIVASGAIISNTSVGSLIVSSGGSAINTYVYANGDVTVSSGGSITSVDLGGLLTVSSGGKINGEITLHGGYATIYPDAGGTINFPGNGNHGLTISGLENGGIVTTLINNFDGASTSWSDQIKLAGIQTSNVTNVAFEDVNGNINGDFVTLILNNGNKISLNIPGAKNEGYHLASDSTGNLIYEVCFLAGSMIKTLEGEIAVEDIRIGDKILSFNWQQNKEDVQSVRWVGNKTVKVNPTLHDDEAGYPVRILKDAIAEGIPCKDLLITPEHCLFFNGKFTPARMFVNGYSIFYDYSITNYTYYHFETEEHSVIWANGVLTESYLDTGNQTQFNQHGDCAILIRPKKTKTWGKDAGAPLMVDRSYVEPLYHTLLQRAIKMDLPMMQDKKQLTHDPDFHLITQDGLTIEPISHFQGRYIFPLPDENIKSVYLVSRTSRLNDIDGPFEDNRHELGISVGSIQIVSAAYNIQVINMTNHLTQDDLPGWHTLEQQPCRWTKGKALLNLPDNNHKERKLIIQVCSDRAYPLKQKQIQSIAV
ncbi:Hint domain-containing protein [Commensalibacter papalotli (ex Servin-Garciduenas et al. 2014)]|uniref:Outer membrane protein n=1 Tax=Commensalibacter papalotli (ex Servin-Garciduenas et al. 2014) TaxID=1208583 RepID=W7DZD6_9PROT|nr:Hint domain-containing protein [Commensalibacter papalotli (ex Servin-Garciduenas et al. 2014)]EUK18064.1 outer membrane protein [Commensalibacter papalotli (ex Servin-Garciduenas et al. 2014)]